MPDDTSILPFVISIPICQFKISIAGVIELTRYPSVEGIFVDECGMGRIIFFIVCLGCKEACDEKGICGEGQNLTESQIRPNGVNAFSTELKCGVEKAGAAKSNESSNIYSTPPFANTLL